VGKQEAKLLFLNGAEADLGANGEVDGENDGTCSVLPGTRTGKRVYGIKNESKVWSKIRSLAIRCCAANARAIGGDREDNQLPRGRRGRILVYIACSEDTTEGEDGTCYA
jgi:hypothetical protein